MTLASEHVLALIFGYPSRLRKQRKLVVLQAVIDDSGKGDKPVFVLAGFVLGAYKWTVFADQWRAILDEPPKIDYFKMKEAWNFTGQFKMFSTKARDEKLRKLVSLITAHKPLAIKEVVPHELYDRFFKGKVAKAVDYPYFLISHNIIGLLLIYQHRNQLHLNDTVDFVFDEQGKESDAMQRAWSFSRDIMVPELKPMLGSRPITRDEKIFLPLQAADLFAWQVRRFYLEKSRGKDYADPSWMALSKLRCAAHEWTEEHLKKLSDMVLQSGLLFEYNLKHSPKLQRAHKRILRERFPEIK